jgi:tetratricopeptide (TPR) repeat protein
MLAVCLLASLSPQALAAPAAAPPPKNRKKPAPKGDFQTVFSAAIKLYENFEYEQALEQLNRAKALAKGAEQEVAVSLYQGVVQAELDQREQSLASFRTGLYLKPDAKLPVKVSPRVARDFEDVRQAVRKDLGLPDPGSDRPVQPPPDKAPVLTPTPVTPSPQPLATGTSSGGTGRGSILQLTLMGVGAVAAGGAGFFGLQSQSNVRFARDAEFYDQRATKLKDAESQAFVANILFGTASAAALGALAVFLLPGRSSNSPPATGGGSP